MFVNKAPILGIFLYGSCWFWSNRALVSALTLARAGVASALVARYVDTARPLAPVAPPGFSLQGPYDVAAAILAVSQQGVTVGRPSLAHKGIQQAREGP